MLKTSRTIPATPEQIFAAFSDPQRLARWWGPAGFTNTFAVCEFRTGGRWVYTMHGPDGKDYPNESTFAEIDPPHRIIINHISKPKYRQVITLTPEGEGTTVSWEHTFEKEKFEASMTGFLKAANEQNLDRLTAEVLMNKDRCH